MAQPTEPRRERLKRQWLQQAEAAFELMFDADQQDRLVTFDQREARACSLTRELAAWLIEQHIAETRPCATPTSRRRPAPAARDRPAARRRRRTRCPAGR